ncbi:hypothetical protein SKAU_G00276090 [Synaphobranchus kaupii]|uniref:SRCR domain-containing protein n=1 Tax=Synaphobranchus kaupii TaxID=118154 RepID=A0A9Q1IQ68_SYNKA|nr:hypothetical protein SKAU_G00276090 [Synaphobranchus kaupii]
MQGRERDLSHMLSSVNSFKVKIGIWKSQLQNRRLAHFSNLEKMLQRVSDQEAFQPERYGVQLDKLADDFDSRFKELDKMASIISFICNPFSPINVEQVAEQFEEVFSLPAGVDMEIVDLQNDIALKARLCPLSSRRDGTAGWREGVSECEGQVEVYYQQTWRRVLVPWSSREASVTCRQLGCGSAVQVHSSSPSGTGDSGVCLMGFQCSGRESHLGNCTVPHNLTCGSREQVSIVCSIGTKRRVTPVPPSLPIPAVAFLVMGSLYFLLLVVLGVVVFQNRALRRALSQWDHAPPHEAIYEEIEYKLAREGTYSAPRWGSGLYEDPPSGYDDVGDGEGHSLSGDLVMEDTPENYDVITADQHPDSVAGELLEGDAPEFYDDVISMQQGPEAFSGDHVTDTEENYDDAVTLDWIQVGENILAPKSPPAPSGMDYDDVGEEPLERGGAF